MIQDTLSREGASVPLSSHSHDSAPAGAVSWGAIFAGALGAAALSLILLILGTGLGLSSVSPFSRQGLGAAAFGLSAILWITFTQIVASGLGGYLAGRLRVRWFGTPGDEVYFRDTAHGFLSWAVALLVSAALLGSAISSIVGGGVRAGAALTSGVATAAGATAAAATSGGDSEGKGPMGGMTGGMNASMSYWTDALFRKDPSSTSAPTASASAGDTAQTASEVVHIYANAMRTGALAPADAHYVGQLIAARTGLSQAEAEKRATDTFNQAQAQLQQAEATAREAADKARKASAYAALWLFVSLLAGAFAASLAATYGGRQRDL